MNFIINFNINGDFMNEKSKNFDKKNIEKVLNITDEKLLAKALQQYLNSDKIDNKKGNKNGN